MADGAAGCARVEVHDVPLPHAPSRKPPLAAPLPRALHRV
jgi:hypothetical protein